ncbi:MAG: ATP-binding protein [Pseudomonadota bacterium]
MEQNRAEALYQNQSQRYENLYAMLLEAIPSSFLLIDRDMRIVSANRNFLEKSRRSLSNTIGHRLKEVFPPIIFDHMDIAQRIHQVFDKNQPTRGERMYYRSPGVPLRIYYYRLLPFSWKGVVENVIFLMDDVTEQIRLSEEVRRVERHLASVFESASDIVLSTDMKGKILSWNPAAEKSSGYALNEVRGSLFSEFLGKDHQKEIEKVFAGLKTGKKSKMAEWDLITKGEATIRVSWVCSPMKDEQSKTTGIVAVGRDLTERLKLETQLLQSQKFAALGVMAGGIAHEIRNPLAICSSAAQFLKDEDINLKFRKECADKIHTGIQRASIIIENLLRFARPSAKTQVEQVDLSLLIKETLTLIANQARIQKIELKSEITEEPVLISGNASLLQQVFINLFLNAIKAMPDGGLLSFSMEKEEREVAVRITDTGDGISKKDIDHIFDPFYTTAPVGKGTGLGLSISYSIVQQHSGTIEVDSVKGKGSTFKVKLPLL